MDGGGARGTDESLAHLIAAANRRLEEGLSARLRPAGGVAIEQFRILSALARPESMTMGALAEAALVERPTLTKIVDRMTATGLVERGPDARDRRRVNIRLTQKGRGLQARLEQAAADHEAEIALRLSAVDAAIDAEAARAMLRALAG